MQMTQDFYASDAVLYPVGEAEREAVFAEILRSDEYLSGFLFEDGNGNPAGYAVVSRCFMTETGGFTAWVEEIYLRPEARSHGYGREFFAYLAGGYAAQYHIKRLRLEAERDNERALKLYRGLGFDEYGYLQMVRDL